MSWSRALRCLAAVLLGASSAGGRGEKPGKKKPSGGAPRGKCSSRFRPPEPGSTAVALNGVQLPDTCFFDSDGEEKLHQVFIIGDWGGLDTGDPEIGPLTADHRKDGFHKRDFVAGLDDYAQHRVKDAMIERAFYERPEYVLNVGDNFYWGGVETRCGATRWNMSNFSSQWDDVFEGMYTGEGLDGLQWLGVLGNHDYGGFLYSNGWDQAIMYTWKQPRHGRPMRWVTPAQYWRSTVHYPDFSVDYFFLDTNVYDAFDPFEDMANNICSFAFNPSQDGAGDCTCEGGPADVMHCQRWFKELWEEQLDWLRLHLSNSTADWQIIVTHFPPSSDPELFANLSADYGVDLFVTGHLHRQELHGGEGDEANFLAPTAWIVSGGGGGITSDYMPSAAGDSQYGFMRMTLEKEQLEVVNVVHTGLDGDRIVVSQRPCNLCAEEDVADNLRQYERGVRRRARTTTSTMTSHTATATTATTATTTSRTSTTTTATATEWGEFPDTAMASPTTTATATATSSATAASGPEVVEAEALLPTLDIEIASTMPLGVALASIATLAAAAFFFVTRLQGAELPGGLCVSSLLGGAACWCPGLGGRYGGHTLVRLDATEGRDAGEAPVSLHPPCSRAAPPWARDDGSCAR